jgi:hypothetical protein
MPKAAGRSMPTLGLIVVRVRQADTVSTLIGLTFCCPLEATRLPAPGIPMSDSFSTAKLETL